jgi:hypothetical protein
MISSLLLACPICFGGADTEQVRAAKIGVLVLLGCIVPLLLAIGFIARSWAKRARMLDAAEKREPRGLSLYPSVFPPSREHAEKA